MADAMILDPEVEAVLRDVAKRPRSCLLRVPRAKVLPSLLDDASTEWQRTGLSSAEKELLNVHRCEVAWLLRQACLTETINGSKRKYFTSRFVTADKECRVLQPTELEQRAREECKLAEYDSILALLLGPAEVDPEHVVVELASASFRLEATNSARLLAARDMARAIAPRAALRVSRIGLNSAPTPNDSVRALENIAMIHARLGNPAAAHAALLRACDFGPKFLDARMSCFLMALQAGDRLGALTSARALDEHDWTEHPGTRWFIHAVLERRKQGEWHPTPRGASLAGELQSDLGATAKEIANVLR